VRSAWLALGAALLVSACSERDEPRHERMIPVVGAKQLEAEIAARAGPVLVDYGAAWCPPCRTQNPILIRLLDTRPDLVVLEVDMEERENGRAFGQRIRSIPVLEIYRGGEKVWENVGLTDAETLERRLGPAAERSPSGGK
jgi:thioredoxin 1